jgi:hypothetical protein
MTEIPATVSVWTDEQTTFVALAENTLREQLSPPRYILYVKQLLASMERCFGPDLGKRASGLATAAKAKRDPVSNQFVKDDAPEEPATEQGEKPVTSATLVTGESPPRSHTTLLAETTGKHPSNARLDAARAKALTEAELRALDIDGVTQEHLTRLVKELDAEGRSLAINEITMGMDPDQAIDEAKRQRENPVQEDPEVKAARLKVVNEEGTSDKEWLATYCNTIRPLLQNTTRFDMDALAYRVTRAERELLRQAHGKLLVNSRNKSWSPAVHMMANVCWMSHPSLWSLCSRCHGKNQDQPECAYCSGCGYKLKISTPNKIHSRK